DTSIRLSPYLSAHVDLARFRVVCERPPSHCRLCRPCLHVAVLTVAQTATVRGEPRRGARGGLAAVLWRARGRSPGCGRGPLDPRGVAAFRARGREGCRG